MTEHLSQEQLNQVIAEIQKISDKDGGIITTDQAREILQEMNLSPELLEEALIQVKRKQAQSEQNRLNLIVVGGVLLVSAIAIGGVLFTQNLRNNALKNVGSQSEEITLANDTNISLQVVTRPNQVVYRVTLKDAPIGEKLPMACNWINPGGAVVHQNRYQTKAVTTSVWNTQCKFQLDSGAPTGEWQVTMLIKDRPLATTAFEVK